MRKVLKSEILMKASLIVSLVLMLLSATLEAQDLIKMINQDSMSMSFKNSSLACLLTDSELVERKNELQREILSKVKKVEEANDGYLFYFDDIDDLLPKLFNYILEEKKCCPFFQQVVSIGPHNAGIIWQISGENGTKEVVRETFEKISFPGN